MPLIYDNKIFEFRKESKKNKNWVRAKPWLRGVLGDEFETVGQRGERWAFLLLKRVIRQALLEVLSRLNGATEGNIRSITLVSLTYSPPPSPFPPHDAANIFSSQCCSLSSSPHTHTPPLLFFFPSFLPRFPLFPLRRIKGDHCPVSQSN